MLMGHGSSPLEIAIPEPSARGIAAWSHHSRVTGLAVRQIRIEARAEEAHQGAIFFRDAEAEAAPPADAARGERVNGGKLGGEGGRIGALARTFSRKIHGEIAHEALDNPATEPVFAAECDTALRRELARGDAAAPARHRRVVL